MNSIDWSSPNTPNTWNYRLKDEIHLCRLCKCKTNRAVIKISFDMGRVWKKHYANNSSLCPASNICTASLWESWQHCWSSIRKEESQCFLRETKMRFWYNYCKRHARWLKCKGENMFATWTSEFIVQAWSELVLTFWF